MILRGKGLRRPSLTLWGKGHEKHTGPKRTNGRKIFNLSNLTKSDQLDQKWLKWSNVTKVDQPDQNWPFYLPCVTLPYNGSSVPG
jgi:hypothetical protein